MPWRNPNSDRKKKKSAASVVYVSVVCPLICFLVVVGMKRLSKNAWMHISHVHKGIFLTKRNGQKRRIMMD